MMGIVALVGVVGGYFAPSDPTAALDQGAVCCALGAAWAVFKIVKGLAGDRSLGLEYAPLDSGLVSLLAGHVYEEFSTYEAGTRYATWMPSISKVARCRYVVQDVYFTAHPQDFLYIFSTKPDNFKKGPAYKMAQRVLGNGLAVNIDDDQAAAHRRELSVAFSPASLKYIANLTVPLHARRLQQLLRKSVTENGRFFPRKVMLELTMRVTAEAAFRVKDQKRQDRLIGWFTKAWDLNFNMARLQPAVDAALIPQNIRIKRLVDQVKNEVTEIQREIKAEDSDNSRDNDTRKALIDYLVTTSSMTPQEITDHCMTFLFAGYDTTACTLSFLMWALGRNPKVQDTLFEELKDTVGRGVTTSVEDLKTCVYLVNCLKETLRLYPPVSHLTRIVQQDEVLPGTRQFLPKGATVGTNFYRMHHATEIYGPDVDTFRPERWDEEEVVAKAEAGGFLPFSAGRRNCIGKDFAMNEMIILAAAVIRNYKISWPEDQNPPPKRVMSPLMAPDMEFQLCIAEREE